MGSTNGLSALLSQTSQANGLSGLLGNLAKNGGANPIQNLLQSGLLGQTGTPGLGIFGQNGLQSNLNFGTEEVMEDDEEIDSSNEGPLVIACEDEEEDEIEEIEPDSPDEQIIKMSTSPQPTTSMQF